MHRNQCGFTVTKSKADGNLIAQHKKPPKQDEQEGQPTFLRMKPPPLFFPGLRGRAAGGHPRSPPTLPRPGKNHPAIGRATLRSNALLSANE
jgi:hypothetical protein